MRTTTTRAHPSKKKEGNKKMRRRINKAGGAEQGRYCAGARGGGWWRRPRRGGTRLPRPAPPSSCKCANACRRHHRAARHEAGPAARGNNTLASRTRRAKGREGDKALAPQATQGGRERGRHSAGAGRVATRVALCPAYLKA